MMHSPIQIARPTDLGRFDKLKEAASATRVKFVDAMANTNTLVIGSHFADPSAGHVVRDAKGTRLKPAK